MAQVTAVVDDDDDGGDGVRIMAKVTNGYIAIPPQEKDNIQLNDDREPDWYETPLCSIRLLVLRN